MPRPATATATTAAADADGATVTPGGILVTGAAPAEEVPTPAEFADRAAAATVKGPWPPEEPEPQAPPPADAIAPLALEWRTYCEWRKTKCPPPECRGAIWLDELDQAIHELFAAIGALAQLLVDNGPFLLAADPETARLRRAAEDRIGDVVFAATWTFDLIDPSFFGTRGRVVEGFLDPDGREALRRTHREVADLRLTPGMLNQFHKAPDEAQALVHLWLAQLEGAALNLFVHAAPLSARFKSLRWARARTAGNPWHDQEQALFLVCVGLDALCELAGLSLLKAVARNQARLDRRYPDGWRPGGGTAP